MRQGRKGTEPETSGIVEGGREEEAVVVAACSRNPASTNGPQRRNKRASSKRNGADQEHPKEERLGPIFTLPFSPSF